MIDEFRAQFDAEPDLTRLADLQHELSPNSNYRLRRWKDNLGVNFITPDRKGMKPPIWVRWVEGSGSTLVDLNPGRMQSLEQFLNVLWCIFGRVLDAKITRLDFAVNLPFRPEFLRRRIRFSGKSKIHEHTEYGPNGLERLLWFVIGVRRHQLAAYRKKTENGPVTRLEIRCGSRRCPVRRLSELARIVDFDPFERVELLDPGPPVYDFENNRKAELKRHQLNHLSADVGAQEARRLLGRGGNFPRTYGPVVKPATELKAAINRSYKERLAAFLGLIPRGSCRRTSASPNTVMSMSKRGETDALRRPLCRPTQ